MPAPACREYDSPWSRAGAPASAPPNATVATRFASAHVTPDRPRIFARHGKGYHRRLPALNAALAELPSGTVLDGELVCPQPIEGGRVLCRSDRLSGFMIHPGLHRPADGLTVTLVAFDALAVAGVDLRAQPWHGRRKQLARLLGGATGPLRVDAASDASAAVHDALVADGWEGTVAKWISGRCRCGRRTDAWIKLKSPAAIERDRRRVAAALRWAA